MRCPRQIYSGLRQQGRYRNQCIRKKSLPSLASAADMDFAAGLNRAAAAAIERWLHEKGERKRVLLHCSADILQLCFGGGKFGEHEGRQTSALYTSTWMRVSVSCS